jgi:hypothetical protein
VPLLPANPQQHAKEGPRNNGVLEGITLTKNYTTPYTNIEEPLYEDDSKVSNKRRLDTPIFV